MLLAGSRKFDRPKSDIEAERMGIEAWETKEGTGRAQ